MEYETRRTNTIVNVLAGLVMGALAMYVADLSQGRRRRALLQDKISSVIHHTSQAMTQTLHHTRNRLNGLQASATRLLSPRQAKPIDDHVLQARARSRRSDQWAQYLVGCGGVGNGLIVVVRHHAPLSLLGVAGLGLLAGGAGKRSRRLAAPIVGQTVEIEKTIEINATPEAVFDIWRRYENFPYFLSHVVEMRDLGHNRSYWMMQGHGGAEVEWNSLLTVSERPAKLAWQSESDTSVMHHGTVLLTPTEMGTRATVKLTWSPPAGSSEERVAVLLGEDPQCTLDEDLLRMKQFIERGLPVRETISGFAEARALLH